MAYQQLGSNEQAKETLARLRKSVEELIESSSYLQPDDRAILREAEVLIDGDKSESTRAEKLEASASPFSKPQTSRQAME